MAHIHDVYDQDNHFIIDPITRDITSQSEKISITQYDHNSERFTFEIPKIIEGHDMSLCDKVRVHFINIGSNRSNVSKGVYEVDDIRVSSDDSDMLLFSWLISRAATEYSGKLNFSIRFYCISDDNIVDYSWATSIFTGVKISNGIDNSEAITEDYVDILEQWKNEITMKIDDIDSKIENIKIPEIPTTLPNPQSLTFTGAAEGTYDGSSALTVDIPSATDIPTTLPNPQSLTFTGAVNASYDGSSEVNVEIPSTYGAQEIVIFSRDSVTFANDEDGDMAASINMPMPFTEAGVYRVKIGDRSGICGISQEDIDDWNDPYNSNGYYNIDLWDIFRDENNFNEYFPEGLSYYNGTLNLYDNSIDAGEYPVSITRVDTSSSIKMDKVNPAAIGSFSLNRSPGTIIGAYSHTEGNNNTASGYNSHAEGANTTASGSCSHAEGNSTKASAHHAHAEGFCTTASGERSHAEGYSTTASGKGSHAEGQATTASGNNSHAEGTSTTASKDASHAEGSYTKALGNNSHAEGANTTASGSCSHAEGANTIASGAFSHAEGANTTAFSSNQHVQGKFNVKDSSNVYADIIGNGTSTTKRSNAATVDWSGNAWYAGNVYVGSTSGTNKDEGSKKLATEEYVDNSVIVPVPSSADEEKVLRVVGGKATWVSLPSASGVSF